MRALLRNRTYSRLFAAQLVSLVGTGLATVALGLLAYDLAGGSAGAVLGTALAVKMAAYVVVSPVVGAWADRVPRRTLLVGANVVRGLVVLTLPFATQVWHVYVLVAVLQSAAAAFTPTFQSVLPDVLPDDREYTKALSASQFAVAAENTLSPLLAAAALTFMAFDALFVGTAVGFAVSAALAVRTMIPAAHRSGRSRFSDRLSAGVRVFGRVPALRAVLGFDLVVSAAGAIALVSTVNVVRDLLGGGGSAVAGLLAVSGAGTAAAAVAAGPLLRRLHERAVMLVGAATALAAVGGALALAAAPGWALACAVWGGIGLGTGLVLMPVGRVLRRSCTARDRPAVFAAQFSLSHACWLLTYPLTGWLATAAGFGVAWSALLGIGLAGAAAAALLWPRRLTRPVPHLHDDSAGSHIERAERTARGWTHSHEIVPDRHHRALTAAP
ncbi:MFS transporter [Pseudonocardia lacus]|uniref:MFS transporter n=1 Tax=Pseudonocardia lacus TaxID=2835865 RepID=UPI001BDBDFBE|nr:MFS transporter [Pseudonocardia lacus]